MSRRNWMLGWLISLVATGAAAQNPDGPHAGRLESFPVALDEQRQQLHIPGMSAAILHRGELIWSAGYGLADGAKEEPATPQTRYRIASVSKTLAAVLMMQMVEAGQIKLDTPMREFTIYKVFPPYPERYEEQPITVRHVMSHTSEGVPGTAFSYNGNVYGDLTWVIEQLHGKAYPLVLQQRIFSPLRMSRSVPGHVIPGQDQFITDIAAPYKLAGRRNKVATYQLIDPTPGLPWDGFDPVYALPEDITATRQEALGDEFLHLNGVTSAGGVVTTVLDLARFDAALDRHQLVSQASLETMFTASVANDGTTLPYGLGWFVEQKGDLKLVWHYGWLPPAVSALYLKVPELQLTFLLLANNDQLSAQWSWSTFGVSSSPFARLFLEHFVFPDQTEAP